MGMYKSEYTPQEAQEQFRLIDESAHHQARKDRDEEENRSRKHAAIGQVGKKERGEKGEGKDEEGSHAASSRRARDKVA